MRWVISYTRVLPSHLCSTMPNVTSRLPIIYSNCITIVHLARPTVPCSNLVPQSRRYRRFDLDADDNDGSTDIYEKNKGWTAGKQTYVSLFWRLIMIVFRDKIVTMLFLRKYIHMAKAVRPKLTEAAAAYISACYTDLRSFDTTKSDRERVSVADEF